MYHWQATPCRLRSRPGAWGARIVTDGCPGEGDTLTVHTRSGKSWEARITDVVWSGEDKVTGKMVFLVATKSLSRPRSSGREPVAVCVGCDADIWSERTITPSPLNNGDVYCPRCARAEGLLRVGRR